MVCWDNKIFVSIQQLVLDVPYNNYNTLMDKLYKFF
jgi:hypothetical protein